MKRSVPLAILSLGLVWPGMAPANPGHEVTVAELSAQIAKTPDLPELYFQRAWNYREMQRPAEARADWEKTLSLNPGFLPASRELARMDALEGRMEEGIARLDCAIVAGGANNQLARRGDGARLHKRGILYAPDYVINAGGIINVSLEYLARRDGKACDINEVRQRIAHIPDRLTAIWRESDATGIGADAVADAMAQKLIGRG